jgi:hypothetical protein
MRSTGHVARKEEMRNAYKIFIVKCEGNRPLEDLALSGRITLKWILEKLHLRMWIGLIWLMIGAGGRLL